MQVYRNRRRGGGRGCGAAMLAGMAMCLAGCSGEGPTPEELHTEAFAGVRAAEESVRKPESPAAAAAVPKGEPVAMVNGLPIEWDDVRVPLCEAAGAQVLEDAVLDRLLEQERKSRGIAAPTATDIAKERDVLVDSLVRDARATPEQAERLLETLRRNRGLGETRFNALLRRTALMRRLVRDEVSVSAADIAVARDLRFGVRYRIRVILVPSERQASEVRAAIVADAGRAGVRFSEEAVRVSTDPSAARGGLIEPISPADTTYPASLRRIVGGMEVGAVSPVIAVDNGFALVLLEEKIAARTPDATDAALEAELRQRLERVAMDGLARKVMAGASITVQDKDLAVPWRERRLGAP